MVTRPLLLRPAFLGKGANRDFSGVVLVTSAKSETVWKRRPGLVGLYCFTPIFFLSMGLSSCSYPRSCVVSITAMRTFGRGLSAIPSYHAPGCIHQQPDANENYTYESPAMQVKTLGLYFFAKNSHLLANALLVLNIGMVPKQAIL